MACYPNRAVALAIASLVVTSACQSSVVADSRTVDTHADGTRAVDSNALDVSTADSHVETQQPRERSGGTGIPAERCEPRWSTPVIAEIVDRFRRPDDQYSAGNRGIEFGTVGGEPVIAVQAGEVVFAGPVGGDLFIVIRHDDGLKLTYGYVADKEVAAGETVSQGELLGHASTGFHLTVRESGRYLDPQPFLEQCISSVQLVPVVVIDQ